MGVTDPATGKLIGNLSVSDLRRNLGGLSKADALAGKRAEVSQPGDLGMSQPGDLGMSQPGDLGMSQPGDPGMSQPGDLGMSQPGDPGMSQPGDPGMSQPGDLGMSQPGDLGMSQPGDPGMSQPGDPGMSQPGDPGMSQPGDPGMSQPGDLGMSQPGDLGMSQPGDLGMSQLLSCDGEQHSLPSAVSTGTWAQLLSGAPAISVTLSSSLENVLELLAVKGLHRVYVVDGNGNPASIITLTDVLRLVTKA
eukprot:gene12844-12971_t